MTKNNEKIEKIYICNYGQTEFPVCVDLGHEYCKLDFQKSKECNLRAVVSYDDYLRKEQECEELKEKLQKYIDREQWEIELNKKRADSFKEMRRMLYGKYEGNSLIEKRSPNERI